MTSTSAPMVAPIRQPRGPSSNAFGSTPPSTDPPAADSDLRRANSVSSTRGHQASASISSTPAATFAFHGARYKTGVNRFRSGSLTASGPSDPGLVRKGSGRAVRTEEVVPESVEEGTTKMGSWGKGLGRQSSLPSRRGFNPVAAAQPVPELPQPPSQPPPRPPRPPRRISVATPSGDMSPPPPPSSHSTSLSLSSLALFTPPIVSDPHVAHEDTPSPDAAISSSLSRTQSLRAQAKSMDASGLNRSSSLKTAGEHHRPIQALSQAMSPPRQTTTTRNFTPSTPPPVSSAAALPPFGFPEATRIVQQGEGADIRRHQSLTQGYGANSRVRDRLERTPALLNLDHRDDPRQRDDSNRLGAQQDIDPPTSPIGHSVWSPSQGGDDGWNRPALQQMQDSFEAMQLGRKMMGGELAPRGDANLTVNVMRGIQTQPSLSNGQQQHLNEEPSWVAGLVGHVDRASPRPQRLSTAPNWTDRDAYHRGQPGQTWSDQYLIQPLNQSYGFLQQSQQPMSAGYPGQPSLKPQMGYQQPFPGGYLGTPFNPGYPVSPASAPLPHQDMDVIKLAKQKGLNPATFDCRPAQARFFVVKSYTEDDVQKSLKHEIWSSTVLGNKRLDGAFRESSEQMPIYLFFSVNGSRHFCGVARMLTPVDDSQSSTVWAQDKWKGIFKVKWIFVRDVPTSALRHIRLINTPEQKPITNSRDTQELHYDAGCEVLQIFLDHQTRSKTSLLQDFAYYERMSAGRMPQSAGPMGPPPAPQQTAFPPQPPAFQQVPQPMINAGVPPVPSIPSRFR